MKRLLQKLIKGLAYFAAALVIVLAIAVGIFRLMLPRLPEYQEEIKTWASSAIGMGVEFTGMNARWRLSGPELSFFDASLTQAESGTSILTAGEVSVGVGLLRLIRDRELVVDRISIVDSSIDLRQDENGDWMMQGIPLRQLLGSREMPSQDGGDVVVVGQNISVVYEHPQSGQLVPFTIRSGVVSRDNDELGIEANVELHEEFGDRLEISANQVQTDFAADVWRLFIEGDALNLSGWSRLQSPGLPEVTSGIADVSVWLDVSASRIERATANVVVADLLASGTGIVAPFSFQGSFEYSAELDGWLLAANQLRIETVDGDWPQSTIQLRVISGADGTFERLRTSASYFNLDDLKYLAAWLPQREQQLLDDFAPSGVLRGVSVELGALQSDAPEFDVSADLQSAGFAARGEWPGLREFSGRIRADRDGGRVEIESRDLRLDLGPHLAGPVTFDDAFGTVIWRRNQDGMIVLSDSVRIRNAELDSQMSLQVSVPSGDGSPVVDFESNWSVHDLGAMHRYLPLRLITPQLRQWLTDALVSGQVTEGTTRFNGALDRFPFDEGDGAFRIEAKLQDAILQYSDKWPAPEFLHLDLVVENTHLYSFENSAINLGNNVEDARIEIADLRKPVLSIEAFATGTLESIRNYAAQSPINEVLGGQLDTVTVAGDASFDLSISYPIQDKEKYDFSTRIRASNGMVRVAGFKAPLTELNGIVLVSRDDVSSESLFGHMLGQPVDLSLRRIGDATAPHSVILDAVGSTTAEALQRELGVPLGDVLQGDAEYRASLRFPNGGAPQPGHLQVMIESDLYGLQSNLPSPLGKSDDVALPIRINIEFPAPGEIATNGSLADDINWTARFQKEGDAWDFDRGVLAIGEYPRTADVRGLHIHGHTPELRLHDWLAVGRRGDREVGLGERIRSIDLVVDHLHAIGQKFTNHRIEVNRGGQDWMIAISGAMAQGIVTVPYDFASGRPMTLAMERLILPGDDEGADNEATIDPRALPAMSIDAREFAFGERQFGSLSADFERTDRGLESVNLKTTDKSFHVNGSARWVIDPYEESGQRTSIQAQLISSDVHQTSQRLNYDSGISSGAMQVDLDVGWAGGPRRDFLSVLNGSVAVQLAAGRLLEVEPGAGRVFGLMSFVALPRRLALDFRDVFESGFSFDRITGNFRLVNGDAFTCDLTLAGPAADVGIVGRAGLVTRDYDQSAIVSANVGNTLPVVGGVLGGPQVAAALLLFSQIFKKPLREMGEVYYSVAGSWDDPVIGTANSERFAAASSLAGCIAATE